MPAKKRKRTIPQIKKTVQTKFNRFIRGRDSSNGFFKCISCGEYYPVEKMNAGHYFSVRGNDGLRFNEYNVHGECSRCNLFDHSHLIWYGINLKERIGEIRYNALIEHARYLKKNPKKWTMDELDKLNEKYK